MRRGEIWTAASGKGHASTPRPVVIGQDNRFEATASVTVCAFTIDANDAPLLRIPVDPDTVNGLRQPVPTDGRQSDDGSPVETRGG